MKYPLILEGQVNEDVLELVSRDVDWMTERLHQQQLELKDIYLGKHLSGELIAHLYEK